MATQTLLTVEQFLDLPDQEGVFRELDEGAVIEMTWASPDHGRIQSNAVRLLGNLAHQTQTELVVSLNTAFQLGPDTVRVPDVFVARTSPYRASPVVRGVVQGCPDLALEVVSKNDTAIDIDRKVRQYLQAGAVAVWLIYSETRHILVYRRPGEIRTYEAGQTIEEPELMPGLAIPVDELFEGVAL